MGSIDPGPICASAEPTETSSVAILASANSCNLEYNNDRDWSIVNVLSLHELYH